MVTKNLKVKSYLYYDLCDTCSVCAKRLTHANVMMIMMMMCQVNEDDREKNTSLHLAA